MTADKRYIPTPQRRRCGSCTRIRLARNLADYPSPHRLDTAGKEKVGREVRDAVMMPALHLRFIEMKDLTKTNAVALPKGI